MKRAYEDPKKVKECMRQVKVSNLEPWAKTMCTNVLKRYIPIKPSGIVPEMGIYQTRLYCGKCGQRIRSGSGSTSRTKDIICRNCFTVIDWSWIDNMDPYGVAR